MPNPKPMKVDHAFREWLLKRQRNMQRMLGVPAEAVKVTMMDTQRAIAQTDGVIITKEMMKRLKK